MIYVNGVRTKMSGTATLIVVLLCMMVVAGCGARGEVARDNVLAQVDSLLGEINVKKKEAEIGVRNLTAGLDKITKGKIEAKIRLTKLTDKSTELEEKLLQVDKALERLRNHLKDEKDVEINGKTFSPQQLKEMAETMISSRKKLTVEIEALKSSQKRLENVVTSLQNRETEGRERLETLKRSLDEIDTKAIALKSMQEAAGLSGNTEVIDFDGVSKQVADLSTRIDVELAFQDEKAGQTANEVQTLETILRETSTTTDTVSEIDKILGNAD